MANQLCPVCGKEIELSPNGRTKRFCSKKCRGAWWYKYHTEHSEEEGANTGTCQYCGKSFPIISESRGSQKYCSHDCYIKARFYSKAQETASQSAKVLSLPASDTGEQSDAEGSPASEPYERKVSRKQEQYKDNPYVRVNLRGRLVVNDAFLSAARPFRDRPIKEILEIFEIDPLEFSAEEANRISQRLKKSATAHLAMEDAALPDNEDAAVFDNEVALSIAINRMMALEADIDRLLQQIKGMTAHMKPADKKALCLMLEGFPKDPMMKYTKRYLYDAAGIAHNSYYSYVRDSRYGLSVNAKDALDERDVRLAFEYKGYPKGVRMVYMLIPRLTGRKIGIDRVRRIMRKYDMDCGLRKPSEKKAEARKLLKERRKPNLLRRMFRLHRPNEVRLTDVTEIKYGDRLTAYGSALIDPVTGVLVALDISDRNDLDLAMTTLHHADKHPCVDGGILHSDQGVLYLSPVFQSEAEAMGLTQSMSRRGNCWDNAPQESFFGHFKDDCREKYTRCESIVDLKSVIEEYAYYYNCERGMWERNHMTPMEYEAYLLSLTDEAFAAHMERETKRYTNQKEEAKRKAIERYRNGLQREEGSGK